MFTKPEPTISYQLLQALSQRKKLNQEEDRRKRTLEIGLEGEMKFYKLLKSSAVSSCLPIFNLQIEVNMNEVQIDCLLIFNDVIYLLDVKNYQGNYKVGNGHWENMRTKTSMKDPLHQLSRATMLLQSWLRDHQFSHTIIPQLIFMHPNFFLYEAKASMPIIFPGQHTTFLNSLHVHSESTTDQQQRVADKLTSIHVPHSRHEFIPTYTYEELYKGIFCQRCSKPFGEKGRKYFYCIQCNNKETLHHALFRSIKDFQLLFPEIPIQVDPIKRWVGSVLSKSTIRVCLSKNFKRQGTSRGTCYLLRKKEKIQL